MHWFNVLLQMDSWVTRNVLGKNISTCGFQRNSIVHTHKAEAFLQRAVQVCRQRSLVCISACTCLWHACLGLSPYVLCSST